MKTLTLLSVLLPVVASMLLACGTAEDAATSGSDPNSPANGASRSDATTASAAAAGDGPDALPAACTAYFDGLAARKTRCASESNALLVDAFEGARESAVARCLQQGANPGTGYTPAFYGKCREALDAAACGDVDTIVKACWEPRGALVRGMACATDDQCADGYCKLQEGAKPGSTCGKCDVPVWGKLLDKCFDKDGAVSNVKCKTGLVCFNSYCTPALEQSTTGKAAGESCVSASDCASNLTCTENECVPVGVARVGERCDGPKRCAAGALCAYKNKEYVCQKIAGLGESCSSTSAARCASWLECSGTQRCELPEILKCN